MKILARCAIVGAVGVAVLAVVFAVLLSKPAVTGTEGVVFASAEPVDVRSVTVRNKTGEYSFYFEEDGYILDDIPPAIADLDAFIAFMTTCGRLSAVRQIAEKDADFSVYGLSPPAATAEIDFFDGAVLKLSVGGLESISQNYYATVEGFEGVYIIQRELAEQFLLSKKQIISRYVTPVLDFSSPLSAVRDVTFTGGSLGGPVSILSTAGDNPEVDLAALSFGTATHIVRGEGVYQLDQTYGVEIMGSLLGITASDVAGYNLSDEEIASYGFDEPYMTVEFDMISGDGEEPRHILLKLVEIDNASFYATVEGSGAVYVIGREPFIDIMFEKLPLRWFLTPLLMDLKSVAVESTGNSYRFDIDNADVKNPVVTYNGETLDVGLFRSFFRLITSAANDGVWLGKLEQPDTGEILTITYEYSDAQKTPDTMTLYPGAVRRANVFVNGAGEFAMKDLFAERVMEGCANLIAGTAIEENW